MTATVDAPHDESRRAHYLLALAAGDYGVEDLKVLRFELKESLSELFELSVEFASRDPDLDFDRIAGGNASFTLRGSQGERHIHGIATAFRQVDHTQHHTFYKVEIRPRAWRLKQRTTCRIFQDKDLRQVVDKVMKKAGLTPDRDFRFELSCKHPKRENCSQYRETDFDFVSRLLEEEGVFYFFEHHDDHTVMVMADSPSVHKDIEGGSDLRYAPRTGLHATVQDEQKEQVTRLSYEQRVRPGKFTSTDYRFEKPTMDLSAEAGATRDQDLEIYDYPGDFVEYHDLLYRNEIARIRLEEQQAGRQVADGRSSSTRLIPGNRFDLIEHPRDAFNTTYLITRVHHRGHQEALEEETAIGDKKGEVEPLYGNEFWVIPADVPFRPARTTKKPVVQGSQTAIVIGPTNQEIHCDEHSRVRVHFHWDRPDDREEDRGPDDLSCWIRVSQPWAGKGWGGLAIPRIGQEVIIDFLEGDPDRPIMTGRLYNGDTKPPQTLPAAAANMTIRSQSLGGSGGSNEITMNDTKGEEGFYVHAQYDMTEVVENNRTSEVHANESVTIDLDRTKTVSKNETTTIGLSRTETVGTTEDVTVQASRTHTVNANDSLTVAATQKVSVGANQVRTIGATSNEMVGALKTASVGAAYAITVGGAMNIAVGLASAEEVGLIKKIVAGSSIELICGAASIKLESGGKITIKGTEFLFESSGPTIITGDPIDLNP